MKSKLKDLVGTIFKDVLPCVPVREGFISVHLNTLGLPVLRIQFHCFLQDITSSVYRKGNVESGPLTNRAFRNVAFDHCWIVIPNIFSGPLSQTLSKV